jgi:2-hydroxyglutaryl-CoA dehydratase, D-component
MSRHAGITSNTVPWEILRAAGYSPRLLEHEPGPTPYADLHMEDVFDPRIRVIFDRLCAGAWSDLDLVVIPRTSEQEHKLYLYLRETSRQQLSKTMPRLYLYDLLHTRTPEAYSYGLERTREMIREFDVSCQRLREAIVESNRARKAVREIRRKREQGLLEGSAAVELIREFYTADRILFADRAPAQLEKLCAPVPAHRPRILIKGALPNSSGLHRLVEKAGACVVAEDHWLGSRAAGATDINENADPITAIFEKYFYDESSPRLPSRERDEWFQSEIASGHIDAVLFHIPFEDDVEGWDHPRQSVWLKSHHVPSTLVRDASDTPAIVAFIAQLSRNPK